MKIVTNTSSKLINVAGYTLMPGDNVNLPEEDINNPVLAMAEMGMLRIETAVEVVRMTEEPKTAVEDVETEAEKEEAETVVTEKAEPVRRTRKKKEE